eukprot:2027991-Alexandrium_andersonii.AAC.1
MVVHSRRRCFHSFVDHIKQTTFAASRDHAVSTAAMAMVARAQCECPRSPCIRSRLGRWGPSCAGRPRCT